MRLRAPHGKTLWLTYCMNVHEGSAEAQERAIRETVLPLRDRLGIRGPFGVGLRFHASGLAALARDEARRAAFAALLKDHALVPFTANGFVVGAFHGRAIKDRVYAPSWRSPDRRAYTLDLARLMADLAREASVLRRVSLSTSPLAWRGWGGAAAERDDGARALAGTARDLVRIEEETGVRVELGLEPEPGCLLQTSEEVASFLDTAVRPLLADAPDAFERLGVCYDVCHQAVMHEEVEDGLRAFAARGIRVVKAQFTSALEVPDPRDGAQRRALASFDEPVYLHQVGGRDEAGAFRLEPDIGAALGSDSRLDPAAPWRVHFHVPVFRDRLVGGLVATRPHLDALLARAAKDPPTDHLEIETYTFDVLPDAERRAGSGHDLLDALEREVRAVLDGLAARGVVPVDTRA